MALASSLRIPRVVYAGAQRPDTSVTWRRTHERSRRAPPRRRARRRPVGTELSIKAAERETGGAYSLIEAGVPQGGLGPLPHRHLDREESFFVLEGEIDFRVGDDTIRGTRGSFLLVPRGVVHTFSNAGSAPARILLVHSPSFEGYFAELGALAASGTGDQDAVAALMKKWGMDVVDSE
jgi:quercetin dioxygenase-like cupin family protein